MCLGVRLDLAQPYGSHFTYLHARLTYLEDGYQCHNTIVPRGKSSA